MCIEAADSVISVAAIEGQLPAAVQVKVIHARGIAGAGSPPVR